MKILNDAINHFGKKKQIAKVREELLELALAITRYESDCSIENGYEVCDECADVEIMIAQLRMMTDPKLINDRKKFKLNRLSERIAKESK